MARIALLSDTSGRESTEELLAILRAAGHDARANYREIYPRGDGLTHLLNTTSSDAELCVVVVSNAATEHDWLLRELAQEGLYHSIIAWTRSLGGGLQSQVARTARRLVTINSSSLLAPEATRSFSEHRLLQHHDGLPHFARASISILRSAALAVIDGTPRQPEAPVAWVAAAREGAAACVTRLVERAEISGAIVTIGALEGTTVDTREQDVFCATFLAVYAGITQSPNVPRHDFDGEKWRIDI
jgi:hypothetical protein